MGLIWFVFLLASKLDGENFESDYEESLIVLSACLVNAELNENSTSMCGKTPKLRPSFGLEVALVVVVPGLGLFAMMTYGVNFTLFYTKSGKRFSSADALKQSKTTRMNSSEAQFCKKQVCALTITAAKRAAV